jgi:hypothetical protein
MKNSGLRSVHEEQPVAGKSGTTRYCGGKQASGYQRESPCQETRIQACFKLIECDIRWSPLPRVLSRVHHPLLPVSLSQTIESLLFVLISVIFFLFIYR